MCTFFLFFPFKKIYNVFNFHKRLHPTADFHHLKMQPCRNEFYKLCVMSRVNMCQHIYLKTQATHRKMPDRLITSQMRLFKGKM